MIPITASEIAKAVGGRLTGENSTVTGVCIDSRKIKPGELFVPLIGEKVDGHDFIGAAMEKGACCFSEKDIKGNIIRVASCAQALKDFAEYYRSLFDAKVVGVTGSVGKSTTKELIASVLSQRFKVLKTTGNFNNEIGLPLTVFNLNHSHQAAVLEMGISKFGEMTALSKIARPDVSVITNIGFSHIEYLGDRNGILRAKSEIFTYMNKSGVAVLNNDDDLLSSYEDSNVSAIFYGKEEDSDVYATNIKINGLEGSEFVLRNGDDFVSVALPFSGYHMIDNALAAAAVGIVFGMSLEEIKVGLESATFMEGRMEFKSNERLTIIDDTYNASPVSMKAALDVLNAAKGRKVCILGDMLELGSYSKTGHMEVGQYASMLGIDLIIAVGTEAYEIYHAAKDSSQAVYFENQEAMMSQLNGLLKEGDTILVKASRGMEFEKTVEKLMR